MKMRQPEPVDIKEVEMSIDLGLQALLEDPVKTGYGFFTGTWTADNMPEWDEMGPKTEGNARILEYSTTSTPFVYVDQGTERHPIVAKNAPTLSFKTGGFPKTKPGQLLSSAGSPGTQQRFADAVIHPGIESRDATGEIIKQCDEIADSRIQNAINSARSY